MQIRRTAASITGLLSLVMISTTASAQTAPASSSTPPPKHTITLTGSAGYLFAQTTGDGGDRMPLGWIATIEGVFNGKIAAVAEFAGSWETAHVYHTNLGGARFIFPTVGRITPFVQLLAGKGRSSAVGDEVSAFTLQPGGGIDVNLRSHIGVRLQGDYDWRTRDAGSVHGYRFATSIVIR